MSYTKLCTLKHIIYWSLIISVSKEIITHKSTSFWNINCLYVINSIYLEAVFSGSDIAKYMIQETNAFSRINKNWTTIMKYASDIKNVVMVCYRDEYLQKLFKHLIEQLQKYQKAFSGFIEKKRQSFPTFPLRFISSYSWNFWSDIRSNEGEKFALTQPFLTQDNIEK